MMRQRLVVDTNVLVSHLLVPDSIPDKVVVRIVGRETLLFSEATIGELSMVLARPKFKRYFAAAVAEHLLATLYEAAELVSIVCPIRACRDPRDDKFLEVAVNGEADAILTGDVDLLAMHPFRGIGVITPGAWLAAQGET